MRVTIQCTWNHHTSQTVTNCHKLSQTVTLSHTQKSAQRGKCFWAFDQSQSRGFPIDFVDFPLGGNRQAAAQLLTRSRHNLIVSERGIDWSQLGPCLAIQFNSLIVAYLCRMTPKSWKLTPLCLCPCPACDGMGANELSMAQCKSQMYDDLLNSLLKLEVNEAWKILKALLSWCSIIMSSLMCRITWQSQMCSFRCTISMNTLLTS